MEFKIYNLAYRIKVEKKERIFGKEFVKNNRNKCMIIYHNKKYKLLEYFKVAKEELKLKFIFHKSLFNLSYMFKDCKSLIQFSFKDEGRNNNFKSKNYIDFDEKEEEQENIYNLKDNDKYGVNYNDNYFKLINIKKVLNTVSNSFVEEESEETDSLSIKFLNNNILENNHYYTIMNGMFFNCSSLNIINYSSNWKFNQILGINHIFYNCSNLKYLPDISNWDTSCVIDFSCIFCNCILLVSLPDISKKKCSIIVNY